MTQAEPNDALQALTAQIPDRGWRLLAAGTISGADGEIGKNSDTSNTMTRDEHQSGNNKTASRRAATSRHTPCRLGSLQEMLNAGMRHIGSNIGGTNRIEKVNVVDDVPPRTARWEDLLRTGADFSTFYKKVGRSSRGFRRSTHRHAARQPGLEPSTVAAGRRPTRRPGHGGAGR